MKFAVEFVDLDEATPRDLHTTTVDAASEDHAAQLAWTQAYLAGDRISISNVEEAK